LGGNPDHPSGPGDPYAVAAPFYDLEYEGYDADLTLYLELARRTGEPILELGCGTGRVALARGPGGLPGGGDRQLAGHAGPGRS